VVGDDGGVAVTLEAPSRRQPWLVVPVPGPGWGWHALSRTMLRWSGDEVMHLYEVSHYRVPSTCRLAWATQLGAAWH